MTEQRGKNILILEKLKNATRTWSKGPLFHYQLIYRWLRDENNPTSVLGQDITYWTKKEAKEMQKNGLFASVNLF